MSKTPSRNPTTLVMQAAVLTLWLATYPCNGESYAQTATMESGESQKDSAALEQLRARLEADANGQYSQALFDALYEKWGPETLITRFKKGISKNPSDARGYLALGTVYERAGRFEEAVAAYRQAIQTAPRYSNAYMALGILYGNNGKYDLALEQLQKVTELDPSSSDAFSNLAMTYALRGEHPKAVPLFQKAIQLNPNNVNFYMRLGQSLIMLLRFEGAISAYETAGRVAPNYWPAYQNLAIVYERVGNLAKARESYAHVLKLAPESASAKKELERLKSTADETSS